jgi:hypothetical protein
VFITAGLQLPLILFILVPGRTGGVVPIQIGAMALNNGSVSAFTVTVVEQFEILLQPSVTVHVIVETPTLNFPLASVPVPFLVVAPVITY